MKSAVANDEKVWFLAAGTKKIGPLTESRVRAKLADGSVSPRIKAWKDGMEEWTPIGSIPLFAPTTPTLLVDEPPAKERPERLVARKPLAQRVRSDIVPRAVRFVAPHRIERADLWRAFGLGFELPRIKVALVAFGTVLAFTAFAGLALWVSPILGALVALGAVPVTLVVSAIAMGALSWQARRAVETGETPPALDALSFAKGHGLALVASPILVSLLALAPPIALVLKSLVSHIPSVGGPAAGITFGVDLALSGLALFLIVAAGLAWQLVPAIVACEEEGPLGTVRALLGVVRSRLARLLFWPNRPWFALSALTLGLVLLAVLVTALPVLLNYTALGLDAKSLAHGKGMLSLLEPGVGMVGMAFWTGVLLAVVAAVVVSTANALTTLLYLACRPGNDDLITRDDWLARRQGELHASN